MLHLGRRQLAVWVYLLPILLVFASGYSPFDPYEGLFDHPEYGYIAPSQLWVYGDSDEVSLAVAEFDGYLIDLEGPRSSRHSVAFPVDTVEGLEAISVLLAERGLNGRVIVDPEASEGSAGYLSVFGESEVVSEVVAEFGGSIFDSPFENTLIPHPFRAQLVGFPVDNFDELEAIRTQLEEKGWQAVFIRACPLSVCLYNANPSVINYS